MPHHQQHSVRKKVSLVVAASLVVMALALGAPAQGPPPRLIKQIGPNLWVAGLQTPNIESMALPEILGRQRMDNWCWAASVQMVLNLDGLNVRQEQVVERIYGGDLDLPASPQQIMQALSGWAYTFRGRPAQIFAWQVVSPDQLVEELSLGWPLIVGLKNDDGSGHAEVMTAVTYRRGIADAPDIQTVVLRDPWPAHESRVQMPWSLVQNRAGFMIRVRVTYPQGL